jgi:riboflavin kinase/FMN adenylyltransferase
MNLGVRPTFGDAAPRHVQAELHVLDFTGHLYGDWIEVEFVARLRDEQRFASPHDLGVQIGRDVAAARTVLGRQKNAKESLYMP